MELVIKGIPGSLRNVYENLCIREGADIWPANYNPNKQTIANTIANVQKQLRNLDMKPQPEQMKGIMGELKFVRGLDNLIEDDDDLDVGLEEARLLHSVEIKTDKRKAKYEPDHIYLDQRGIWVIETKNWRYKQREDYWNTRKKQPKGHIKEAIEQAKEYPGIVAKFLGLSENRVVPVIYDPNMAFIDYDLEGVDHVVTVTSFYTKMVEPRSKIFSPAEIKDMSSKLEKEIRPVMNNRVLANTPMFETW